MNRNYTGATLMVALLVVAGWEYIPGLFDIPAYIIPTFSETLAELLRMYQSEALLQHTLSTLQMTLLGFIIGSTLGAVLGFALGSSPLLEKVVSPYILALQIAPKVAFAPLFIMWFGYTAWPKLLVTILIVFFPILVNVLQSMKTIDRDMINLARAYNLNRLQIFLKIELPSSLPNLLAGLRICATLAVIGVTVGEMVGGNTGLGFLISYGEGQANAAMVFNAIALLTVIGILLYSTVVWAENRILHYIPKAEHR
ncbi:ABC transporter permease [Marinobacterium rhizophilum]|uniref:ABC transporter permease n=1 Tax=Marinobacterium rhizophilum TaxID=420402 RepID=A0ABY5HD55_9GAMM|nr:ABC transporter permease [Marinobacterium rhizophilum]UTW10148.1 ABC transporter permease [Marinobacterium rhizophilum]